MELNKLLESEREPILLKIEEDFNYLMNLIEESDLKPDDEEDTKNTIRHRYDKIKNNLLEEDIISPQSQQQTIDNSPNINNNNNNANNNSAEVNDRVSTTNNNIYNNNDIKIEQKTSFQIAQNSYNNSNANLNIRNTPSQYEYQNQTL